jgi:hypothetical protein
MTVKISDLVCMKPNTVIEWIDIYIISKKENDK